MPLSIFICVSGSAGLHLSQGSAAKLQRTWGECVSTPTAESRPELRKTGLRPLTATAQSSASSCMLACPILSLATTPVHQLFMQTWDGAGDGAGHTFAYRSSGARCSTEIKKNRQ